MGLFVVIIDIVVVIIQRALALRVDILIPKDSKIS